MKETAEFSEERKDVWYTMSDMFLDTELSEADLKGMAIELAKTSYSVEEIERIMQDEVAPILHANLMCVAGQWGMFDRESQVVEPISKRLNYLRNRKFGLSAFKTLSRKFFMCMVKQDWQIVMDELKRLRSAT